MTISYSACSAAHCAVPTGTHFCVLLALEPDQKSLKSHSNPLAESSKIYGSLSNGITEGFRRVITSKSTFQADAKKDVRNRILLTDPI